MTLGRAKKRKMSQGSSPATETPHDTVPSTELRRPKKRKVSQGPSLVTESLYDADAPRNNPPNTTSSLNNNTSLLNGNVNCFNTKTNCSNVSNNITVTDDRSEILNWLSPLDPHLRHYDIQMRRVENVGSWLLGTEQFRSWYSGEDSGESRKATIFCYGNPGAGKTFISSLVIDTLCNEVGEEDIVVACFYFDFAAQKEQSATSTLGALLKQVVSGFEQIPKEIMDVFQKQKRAIGGRRLQLSEIVKLLGSLSSSRPTFFCIDALDECASADRVNILLSLKEVVKISPTARVFITGRPHVVGQVGEQLPEGAAFVSISPRKDDIIRYIHAKLVEDATPDEMDTRLKAEIVEKIPETVSEIFLLVSLNLDAILQETTIYRRRERLTVMTDGLGLGDVYNATLGRIKAQGGQKTRLGMAALMWICHSERPLGAEELCQALAVEVGSTGNCADNVSSIRTVLSCCQGLIVLDKEGSAARLIHYTLHEYLTSHPGIFKCPHSTIAEACLTYLNSQPVMAISPAYFQSAQHPRFLEYCALYWGTHMKKEGSDRSKTLALRLFSHYEYHISVKLFLEHILDPFYLSHPKGPYKFTGLHYASFFGLTEVVTALIGMDGSSINSMDEMGATPLSWAARNGHETLLDLLRGVEDANLHRPDKSNETPFSYAVRNGQTAMVKLLLKQRDINPDRLGYIGGTPIMSAAELGHEAVVKLLLEREDVDPNRTDHQGHTAILWAALDGQEAVVKLLLGRGDVNPDRPDCRGRTPLSHAAEHGYEAVVKLLLGRGDVDPNMPDHEGETPIFWAVENEHEAVVELLLGREDIDPDRLDKIGRTALNWAYVVGYLRIAKLIGDWQDRFAPSVNSEEVE